MILGIVVTRPGLADAEAQESALRAAGASEVKTVAPMTNEDWFYRVREAVSELDETPQKILVQAPHYLGPDGLAIARALVDISEDAELAFLDEDLCVTGPVRSAIQLVLRADDAAKRVNVQALMEKARNRRNATPPKCILVPEKYVKDKINS